MVEFQWLLVYFVSIAFSVAAIAAALLLRHVASSLREARKVREQREWARMLEANQRAGMFPNLQFDKYGIPWGSRGRISIQLTTGLLVGSARKPALARA